MDRPLLTLLWIAMRIAVCIAMAYAAWVLLALGHNWKAIAAFAFVGFLWMDTVMCWRHIARRRL
jgi:hypothetical protein